MVEKTQAKIDPEAIEREVARRYQVIQQEVKTLVSRIMEIEDEQKENQ